MEEWHDHPLLMQAFTEKLRLGWAKAAAEQDGPVPVLFTAHSVPKRTVTEGDAYEVQTRETAALVAAQVPEISDWHFAFQSQGMSGGEWLGPTVEETIARLAEEEHKSVDCWRRNIRTKRRLSPGKSAGRRRRPLLHPV